MRKIVSWNKDWLYKENYEDSDAACRIDETLYTGVELPHTNKMLPYNYLDETAYQFVCCYAKKFVLPKEAGDKEIVLEFEGVMIAAEVYLNGRLVCTHKGGYTPFKAVLTQAVRWDGENSLVVRVDATERPDIPPCGGVIDYLTYGGIYREVNLQILDRTHIEHMFIHAEHCLEEEKSLEARIEIFSEAEQEAEVELRLEDAGETRAARTEPVRLAQGKNTCKVRLDGLKGIDLWDMEHPVLYTVSARLACAGSGPEESDLIRERFGFRESAFKPDGYYLNGKKVRLVGLNRHQSYPYVGYAMPKRVQRKDAELIKEHAGVNLVRTSHYPQSRHFLDRCDELGLLVMEEIPGWQHIGGEAWQAQALQDTRDMIIRDYNRPSVILWGVRINESQDHHDLYTKTNAAAHELDPYRPTGGVRFLTGSEFLEDVYTFNDFSHVGGELVFRTRDEITGRKDPVPTLITESNGHMYPVKSVDKEERLTEHVMRHLRVIQEALTREDLAGGISWCAFDYNTHSSFGSGDKICYHGVYDMFRNPKYAAYAYASQKDPKKEIVLKPATLAARGERDGGGTVPFTVLTNCDFIRVFKNGNLVGDFYPDRRKFPGLAHPPVVITHLLEEKEDFGFSPEDKKRFQEFLRQKTEEGDIANIRQEELEPFEDMAAKYGKDVPQLLGMVMAMAGGWGEKENMLLLQAFLDGQPVCEKKAGEVKSAAGLRVEADETVLLCDDDTYDAVRVVVQAVDTLGDRMPFTQECVSVTLEGPAEIMGPARFALTGGASSFWIKTKGTAGKVRIKVEGMYNSAECCVAIEQGGTE